MKRRRHPIDPICLARRRAMWCAFGTLVLVAVLAVLLACRFAPKGADIVFPEGPPAVYIIPAVTPAPKGTWTRYDVPFEAEFQRYVVNTAQSYGIDPALVLAVIHYETGGTYDPFALGDDGNSFGLMQVWASEHTERMERLGVTDLYDPYQNVLVGCDILAEVIGWDNGLEWALSFYHGAGGNQCSYSRLVLDKADEFTESAEIELMEGVVE